MAAETGRERERAAERDERVKERGAEHVSILTHEREEEAIAEEEEEDRARLPPSLPRVGARPPRRHQSGGSGSLKRRLVCAFATGWNLARLVVMVIDTWSLGRLLPASRRSLAVCLGRGRRSSWNGGTLSLHVLSVFCGRPRRVLPSETLPLQARPGQNTSN